VRSAASGPRLELIAYQVDPNPGYVLEPAPPKRDWMDTFQNRFPYRCLPLAMANQGGWLIRCPATFQVTWNGKRMLEDLKVKFAPGEEDMARAARSHFGYGILTFGFPWLFRTPDRVGLWVHGASNFQIENAYPLEGLVETDWNSAPFTMNWRILRRNAPVFFRKGDPICMITPFPLDFLERFDPVYRDIEGEPELKARVEVAAKSRREIIMHNIKTGAGDWERNYMRGQHATGEKAPEHRTNFKLKPFTPAPGDAEAPKTPSDE